MVRGDIKCVIFVTFNNINNKFCIEVTKAVSQVLVQCTQVFARNQLFFSVHYASAARSNGLLFSSSVFWNSVTKFDHF